MKQISQTADSWISEEEIFVSPALKLIRANDPWQGMNEEEVEDAKEFIRCYLLKDHQLILQIPAQAQENDFWDPNHPEYQENALTSPSSPEPEREGGNGGLFLANWRVP